MSWSEQSFATRLALVRPRPAIARPPVLRVRRRRHRPGADAGAARCRRARRARPPAARRPLHRRQRSAAARPGRASERRGPPVQPVHGPLRGRRRPGRGVAVRLRPGQPPDAQQAVHRRRRDGGGRRPQHRRRVLHGAPGRQLHRPRRVRGRRGAADSWPACSTSTGTASTSIRSSRSCRPTRAGRGAAPPLRAGDAGAGRADAAGAGNEGPARSARDRRRARHRPARSDLGEGRRPSPIRPTRSSTTRRGFSASP